MLIALRRVDPVPRWKRQREVSLPRRVVNMPAPIAIALLGQTGAIDTAAFAVIGDRRATDGYAPSEPGYVTQLTKAVWIGLPQ